MTDMTPTCGIKRAAEVCATPIKRTDRGETYVGGMTWIECQKSILDLPCACETRHAELLALVKELEEANEELRRSVREWVCMKCETVYPGPPQAGCMCLVCPACGGNTVKRDSRAEVFLLRERHAELLALAEKLNKHVRLLNDSIAQQDSAEFEQWMEKNHG